MKERRKKNTAPPRTPNTRTIYRKIKLMRLAATIFDFGRLHFENKLPVHCQHGDSASRCASIHQWYWRVRDLHQVKLDLYYVQLPNAMHWTRPTPPVDLPHVKCTNGYRPVNEAQYSDFLRWNKNKRNWLLYFRRLLALKCIIFGGFCIGPIANLNEMWRKLKRAHVHY